jgi:hypothetical protein
LRLGHDGETDRLPDGFGWRPRPLAEVLAASPATSGDVAFARLFFLKPALRIGLGLLWASTGIISAFIYPVTRSAAMLAGLGLSGWSAAATVYAGATLDLVLGVALLLACRADLLGQRPLYRPARRRRCEHPIDRGLHHRRCRRPLHHAGRISRSACPPPWRTVRSRGR